MSCSAGTAQFKWDCSSSPTHLCTACVGNHCLLSGPLHKLTSLGFCEESTNRESVKLEKKSFYLTHIIRQVLKLKREWESKLVAHIEKINSLEKDLISMLKKERINLSINFERVWNELDAFVNKFRTTNSYDILILENYGDISPILKLIDTNSDWYEKIRQAVPTLLGREQIYLVMEAIHTMPDYFQSLVFPLPKTNTLALYHPKTGRVTKHSLDQLPFKFSSQLFTAGWLVTPDDFFFWGEDNPPRNDVYMYKFSTGTLSKKVNMIWQRAGHGLVKVHRDVYVFGNCFTPQNTAEKFWLDRERWGRLEDLPLAMPMPSVTYHKGLIFLASNESVLSYAPREMNYISYDIDIPSCPKSLASDQHSLFIITPSDTYQLDSDNLVTYKYKGGSDKPTFGPSIFTKDLAIHILYKDGTVWAFNPTRGTDPEIKFNLSS